MNHTIRGIMITALFLAGAVVVPFQANAITISPVKLEISGDPGQILEGEIKLFNEQEDEKTFYSSTENFEARGETGAPFFLSEKVGLATWITTEEKATVKPKKEKIIPFSIVIPKDAEPGGYFTGILWGETPPAVEGGGQVAVGGRVGVLVLLKVSGEVEEAGGLLEFSAKDKQKFFSLLPITFKYRFNNTGGDRVVPQGEIEIKNLFGSISATLPANEIEGSVLPDSARKFEVLWQPELQDTDKDDNKVGEVDEKVEENATEEKPGFFAMAGKQWNEFHVGLYKANLHLTWGSTNQAATATYSFFIIPWQLLLIIFIALVVAVVLGKLFIRKYNRWLISKLAKQQNTTENR